MFPQPVVGDATSRPAAAVARACVCVFRAGDAFWLLCPTQLEHAALMSQDTGIRATDSAAHKQRRRRQEQQQHALQLLSQLSRWQSLVGTGT